MTLRGQIPSLLFSLLLPFYIKSDTFQHKVSRCRFRSLTCQETFSLQPFFPLQDKFPLLLVSCGQLWCSTSPGCGSRVGRSRPLHFRAAQSSLQLQPEPGDSGPSQGCLPCSHTAPRSQPEKINSFMSRINLDYHQLLAFG